jgi:hypothetical protein
MSKTQNTLINGIAYSYVDMSLTIGALYPLQIASGFNGIPIKSIDYSANQSKSFNYENSSYATSLSYGKHEYSGSIKFTLDSFEFLRDQLYTLYGGTRSILDLPASDINITFANKGKVNSHVLKYVVFTKESNSGSEGDAIFSVSADFICSYINFGDPSKLGAVAITQAVLSSQSIDNQK